MESAGKDELVPSRPPTFPFLSANAHHPASLLAMSYAFVTLLSSDSYLYVPTALACSS